MCLWRLPINRPVNYRYHRYVALGEYILPASVCVCLSLSLFLSLRVCLCVCLCVCVSASPLRLSGGIYRHHRYGHCLARYCHINPHIRKFSSSIHFLVLLLLLYIFVVSLFILDRASDVMGQNNPITSKSTDGAPAEFLILL